MTDKQSQTSSQSSPSTDVEMKPDHSTLDTNSGSESSDLLDTTSPPQVAKSSQAVNSASSSSSIRSNGSSSSVELSGDKMIITVAPFTGGPFSVTVNKSDSVEDLKKVVAKKLKVLKERICLLYRERYVIYFRGIWIRSGPWSDYQTITSLVLRCFLYLDTWYVSPM